MGMSFRGSSPPSDTSKNETRSGGSFCAYKRFLGKKKRTRLNG